MFYSKTSLVCSLAIVGSICTAAGSGSSTPAITTTTAPAALNETLLFDGNTLPLGLGQASDPSLLNINGRWNLMFTSIGWKQTCAATKRYDYVVRSAQAQLPAGQTLGAPVNQWQVVSSGSSALEPVPLGAAGQWDNDGVETPKLVTGYDPTQNATVTRVYYTGWKRVQVSTDRYGCPTYGYIEWKIGMAEWNASTNTWVKHSGPVLDGTNAWERMHYTMPDKSQATYSFIGDQSVMYIPGPNGTPGLWHMFFQANTDTPYTRVITVHATSVDGVVWPAQNQVILNTNTPYASTTLPGGPYYVDVSLIGGKFYFVGWVPNQNDPSTQGLWITSSTTPDGSAPGDFTQWAALVLENNGAWWHSPGSLTSAGHITGLFSPTLVEENGSYWLFYTGVRPNSTSTVASLGRSQVSPSAIQ